MLQTMRFGITTKVPAEHILNHHIILLCFFLCIQPTSLASKMQSCSINMKSSHRNEEASTFDQNVNAWMGMLKVLLCNSTPVTPLYNRLLWRSPRCSKACISEVSSSILGLQHAGSDHSDHHGNEEPRLVPRQMRYA